jgi:hypothetical protein
MAAPALAEIEATVERMERRYAHSVHFPAYRTLCLRFAADLADPRDLALAKSAALMLIKQLEGDG